MLERGWDPGIMHFMGSLRNLTKYTLGRELRGAKCLEPLVGLLTLSLAHLCMGSTIIVYAEKIQDCQDDPARVDLGGGTLLSGRS